MASTSCMSELSSGTPPGMPTLNPAAPKLIGVLVTGTIVGDQPAPLLGTVERIWDTILDLVIREADHKS